MKFLEASGELDGVDTVKQAETWNEDEDSASDAVQTPVFEGEDEGDVSV